MEPITIGTIIAAIGGPGLAGGAIYKYGQLNQRVADLEEEVERLEKKVDRVDATKTKVFDDLATKLDDIQKEMIDRLARIETSLTDKQK